jgi:hypothetical protein
MNKMDRVLLNLGCGAIRPQNWVNTDSSLNSLAQNWPLTRKIGRHLLKSSVYESSNATFQDLNRKWPWRENTVDVVYASHLFEHLRPKITKLFLSETYRVLNCQGTIRLVVPDLLQLAKNYITKIGNGDHKASESFLHSVNLHLETSHFCATKPIFRLIYWLQGYPHQHKYMYDAFSLADRLQEAKFVDIRQSGYGRSDYIPEILDVEHGAERTAPAIYLEAKKP